MSFDEKCIYTPVSQGRAPNKSKPSKAQSLSKQKAPEPKHFLTMGRYEYEQEMRRRAYNNEMARRNAIAQEREMAFRAEMQRRQHNEQEHRRRMAMQQHNHQMQQRYGPPRDAVDDGCCGCCMM